MKRKVRKMAMIERWSCIFVLNLFIRGGGRFYIFCGILRNVGE